MPITYPEGGMPGMLLKQRRAVKQAIDTFKVQLVPLRAAPKAKISGPEDVSRLVREMEDYDRESTKIIHLNTKNQVMGVETISIGSLSASIVHPRETVKGAILNNSANVIFIHNHPSGVCEPSNEDVEISGKLKEAFETVGISLLDSIIVGKGCHYSLREAGFLSGKMETRVKTVAEHVPKSRRAPVRGMFPELCPTCPFECLTCPYRVNPERKLYKFVGIRKISESDKLVSPRPELLRVGTTLIRKSDLKTFRIIDIKPVKGFGYERLGKFKGYIIASPVALGFGGELYYDLRQLQRDFDVLVEGTTPMVREKATGYEEQWEKSPLIGSELIKQQKTIGWEWFDSAGTIHEAKEVMRGWRLSFPTQEVKFIQDKNGWFQLFYKEKPLSGKISENIQTVNNIEAFLNRLTVVTRVPIPESLVTGAAIPEDGFLFAYHITDDPEGVMRKLRAMTPLCQMNPEGDLGCGFYVSGVPEYWRVRSREKWEFARHLNRAQRQALVNAILSDPKYRKGGGYLADFEVDYLTRDLKQFVETGDVNLLAMTGNQPYNVRITEEIARKAGVPAPKIPRLVKIKLQGKFINAAWLYSNPEVVNRAQAWAVINRPKMLQYDKRASTQDIVNAWLCSMGYSGAFTKSGMSANPEMVIWDRKAIIDAWIPEPQT